MTKINRLTQIPTLDDSDLAVVWQDSSERTRAITIANLRHFIQSTDPNEPNPTHWVAPDDSVTEEWSNSVKSVCYSSGILASRGSAMLSAVMLSILSPTQLPMTIK